MDDSVGYNGNTGDVEDLMVLEDAPVELVLEVWEPTGDAVVDAALEDLRALDTAELAEHVKIFSSVQDQLRGRLTDLGDSARP
jgi:hypothetical protein